MATLRDIRRQLKSVHNIQKITQAMELVAASRLRKAQAKMEAARPYALELKAIVDRLIVTTTELKHHLIDPRAVKKVGLVVIAGDRGLCGGYNQNVFTAAEKFLHKYESQSQHVELIPVGHKPSDYFATKKWTIPLSIEEWGGKITHKQTEELTKSLIGFYLEGKFDEVWIVYTHFINVALREIRIEKLLNIEVTTHVPFKDPYLFEPDPHKILAEILPYYCTMKIQSALNDAYTSELAARISSMRSATKNAEEMIEKLTLTRNKVRQAGITKELIEITSGAESLHKG